MSPTLSSRAAVARMNCPQSRGGLRAALAAVAEPAEEVKNRVQPCRTPMLEHERIAAQGAQAAGQRRLVEEGFQRPPVVTPEPVADGLAQTLRLTGPDGAVERHDPTQALKEAPPPDRVADFAARVMPVEGAWGSGSKTTWPRPAATA